MTQFTNLLTGDKANQTVVFSGGACNALNDDGMLVRNTTRDGLNAWLDQLEIKFYDPQIHPDSHGREYVYEVDGPGEQAARAAAKVTLYQLGDETLGAVTAMEIVRDALSGKKVVLWLSGSKDEKKRPQFKPAGKLASEDKVVTAALAEYVKAGTNVRKNLVAFLSGLSNVKIVATEDEAKAAIQEFLS